MLLLVAGGIAAAAYLTSTPSLGRSSDYDHDEFQTDFRTASHEDAWLQAVKTATPESFNELVAHVAESSSRRQEMDHTALSVERARLRASLSKRASYLSRFERVRIISDRIRLLTTLESEIGAKNCATYASRAFLGTPPEKFRSWAWMGVANEQKEPFLVDLISRTMRADMDARVVQASAQGRTTWISENLSPNLAEALNYSDSPNRESFCEAQRLFLSRLAASQSRQADSLQAAEIQRWIGGN
ncbi:MAG: hypothetical protein ACPGGK_01145 [Pikeienuella sp.]